jgi:hypothetical protein
MSSQSLVKPASVRQLAYIKRLWTEMGESGPEISGEMSSPDASRMISQLISRARQNGVESVQAKMNEPRLVMAMKECFRLWTGLGRDIWEEKRDAFIKEVINTYGLFTDIADRADGSVHDTR